MRQIELRYGQPHGFLACAQLPLGQVHGVGSSRTAQEFQLPSMPKLGIHWLEGELLEVEIVAMKSRGWHCHYFEDPMNWRQCLQQLL